MHEGGSSSSSSKWHAPRESNEQHRAQQRWLELFSLRGHGFVGSCEGVGTLLKAVQAPIPGWFCVCVCVWVWVWVWVWFWVCAHVCGFAFLALRPAPTVLWAVGGAPAALWVAHSQRPL